MELKKAIRQVAKICPRKQDQSSFQAVRFIPAVDGVPPRVYATDGSRSSVIPVNCQLPNALLDVGMLAKAAKEPGELVVEEIGYGHIELKAGGSTYKLDGMNFDSFPPHPPIPDVFTSLPNWDLVPKVFHAAAPEKEAPELANVHFTPTYVEATDKSRLVRVEISGPWAGLVPSNLFKSWPKGDVAVMFTQYHAYFMLGGEEVRIANIQTSKYPDTHKAVPAIHMGPWSLVPTEELLNAVQRGTEVSELGLLSMEFQSPVKVTLRAWEGADKETVYQAEVPIYHGTGSTGMVLVNGKYLAQTLKEVDTPNIKLGYGNMADPLRLESGPLLACLWQMVY